MSDTRSQIGDAEGILTIQLSAARREQMDHEEALRSVLDIALGWSRHKGDSAKVEAIAAFVEDYFSGGPPSVERTA